MIHCPPSCLQTAARSAEANEEQTGDSAAPGRGYNDIDTENETGTETASSGIQAAAVAEAVESMVSRAAGFL